MPAERAAVTVAPDVLPPAINQPDEGIVEEVLQAYSILAALLALISPVSVPFELVRLVTLTVGFAAWPTVTVVWGLSRNPEFVPVASHISLI